MFTESSDFQTAVCISKKVTCL